MTKSITFKAFFTNQTDAIDCMARAKRVFTETNMGMTLHDNPKFPWGLEVRPNGDLEGKLAVAFIRGYAASLGAKAAA